MRAGPPSKESLIADILHWASDQNTEGSWGKGWNGEGRQIEKLKTSITFHFLNLKQITVCGIHWSCSLFFFTPLLPSLQTPQVTGENVGLKLIR